MSRPLSMPLDELRRRYEALGPIEEWPGERTIRGRCSTFEGLLDKGPLCAEMLHRAWASYQRSGLDPERLLADHPELSRLVMEAWPEA